MKALVPSIKTFWPGPQKIHIDAWRTVTYVDGFHVKIIPRAVESRREHHLFFVNMGGYQRGIFSEQHQVILTVQQDLASAIRTAKSTDFFKHHQFDKAVAHIDDRYGLDVDEVYAVEDILPADQKHVYGIELVPAAAHADDEIHLGYLKLSAL